MIGKTQKIIQTVVLVVAITLCACNANAQGIPIFFKTYMADYMRSWTLSTIEKNQSTKAHNNRKLVEENAERGNSPEVRSTYNKMLNKFVNNMNWGRFGDDPFGTIYAAGEKTVDTQSQEFIAEQKRKGREYLQKKLDEELKEQQEDKAWEEEDKANAAGGGSSDTLSVAASGSGTENNVSSQQNNSGKYQKYKAQVFNWLKKNRSGVQNAAKAAVSGDDVGDKVDKMATDTIEDIAASGQQKLKQKLEQQKQPAGTQTPTYQ